MLIRDSQLSVSPGWGLAVELPDGVGWGAGSPLEDEGDAPVGKGNGGMGSPPLEELDAEGDLGGEGGFVVWQASAEAPRPSALPHATLNANAPVPRTVSSRTIRAEVRPLIVRHLSLGFLNKDIVPSNGEANLEGSRGRDPEMRAPARSLPVGASRHNRRPLEREAVRKCRRTSFSGRGSNGHSATWDGNGSRTCSR